MIVLKVTKKEDFILSLENAFLEKPLRGIKLTSTPWQVPGLYLFINTYLTRKDLISPCFVYIRNVDKVIHSVPFLMMIMDNKFFGVRKILLTIELHSFLSFDIR